MTWCIFDPDDMTYHCGAGDWSTDCERAEPYESRFDAERVIQSDLDPEGILPLEARRMPSTSKDGGSDAAGK